MCIWYVRVVFFFGIRFAFFACYRLPPPHVCVPYHPHPSTHKDMTGTHAWWNVQTERQRSRLVELGITDTRRLLLAVETHSGKRPDPNAQYVAVSHRALSHFCRQRLHGLCPRIDDARTEEHMTVENDWIAFDATATAVPVTATGGDDVLSLSDEALAEYPPETICPITQDVFEDPVVLDDGHTYERKSIKDWLERHGTSPMTNEELKRPYHLVPNHAMRAWIRRLS